MQLAVAQRCSQAALAAYHDPHAFGRDCQAVVEVCDWNAVASFMSCTADELLLVFRGTLVARPEDGQDRWDTMLGGMVFNFAFAQTDGYGGRVHRGFAAALEGIWQPLTAKLRQLGDSTRRLVITGHSKGAALATLAGWRFHQEGRPVEAVYTFGSPRVGNDAFAEHYPVPLYRFEHRDDPVPHLPPPPRLARQLEPFLGTWVSANVDYRHAGELFFLDWSGKLVSAQTTRMLLSTVRGARLLVALFRNRAQALAEHSCEAYAEALRALR
jgi:hypothetical protein